MNQSRAKAIRRELRSKGVIGIGEPYRVISHKSWKYRFQQKDEKTGEMVLVQPEVFQLVCGGVREVYKRLKKEWKRKAK